MPLVHMVLADNDAEYVHRLAQWFRENRPRQFQITAFTAEESFAKYLQSGNEQVDVFLLNEKFLTPELMDKGNLIILGSSAADLPSVEKYQTASSLCAAVLSQISGWQPVKNPLENSGKSNLIVCFSPELRLKSSLALWISRISHEHIYINLEAFPFYSLQSESAGGKNLSDIFYHIKASKNNLAIALESSVCNSSEGICHIPAMDNPGDLWELTDKEICIFAQALQSWGRFSNIIVDLECNTSPRTLQWLELASRVIVPFSAAHPEPALKMKNLLSSLPDAGGDKVRWVLAGTNQDEDLKDHFEPPFYLPWLKELPSRWNTLNPDKQAIEQLQALLQG